MDDLKLIRDISQRLIQVNDQWDRYACNEYIDDTFVPIMHDNTIKTADYLLNNLMHGEFKEYIQDNFRQYGQERLTAILSDLLYGLNRNNELYSIRKDIFKTYVQHFSKRAQDLRVKGPFEKYYSNQELFEMGRDGDWYKILNEECNYYLQFLKPYLVDQEQTKPQPEVAKGRKSGPFANRIISNEKESILKELHAMIDGKKGKDVALIIRAAMGVGWITKPTYTEVLEEFGNIGNKSGFNKYRNYIFKEEELNPIISQLQQQLPITI